MRDYSIDQEYSPRSKRRNVMRRMKLILVASVAIALVLFAGSRFTFGDRAKADVEDSAGGWEYLIVAGGTVNLSGSDGGTMRKEPGSFTREAYPLERNLDKLGAKGWELVTVTGPPADPTFYLKRKK